MCKIIGSMALVSALVMASVPVALANGETDQAIKEAAGWGCAAAVGLPAGHCISPGTVAQWPDDIIARSGTFQLLVFDESGNFMTAEIATFLPAGGRPCPHDPESPDGSYWEFIPGLWVCHHRSE
ncbi:MAG TPA: hypothetical protein VJA85_01410 [Candidatus Limnocylindria bacterium]|nr:hypothetical protein [Candidatus Limnocylindria bacterium]